MILFQKKEFKTQSIFYNFSVHNLSIIDPSNSYKINLQQVDYGSIFVTPAGEAIFSFISPTNSVCCIQMPPVSKALLYKVANQSSANTSLPTRSL